MMEHHSRKEKIGEIFAEYFNKPPPPGYCCYIMSMVCESKEPTFFKVGDEVFMEREDFDFDGKHDHWEFHKVDPCPYCGVNLEKKVNEN